MKMNAVLLAGGEIPADDPLYTEAPFGKRSLIEIHGKPMGQWVLDALSGSEFVGDIYITGLEKESGLIASKPIHFMADQGDLFENIRSGALKSAEDHPGHNKVLIVAADIPAIRPKMVDWLVQKVESDPDKLIYYNVINRDIMEARFPGAGRSYVRLKDITVCGGDLNAVDSDLFKQDNPIWKKLTEARKNPVKQMTLLGIDSLLMVALRMLSLEDAVKRISKKLAITAAALVNPYPEIAMDADKKHQLEILRRDLEP